jgi:acetamidase/formamidase
MSTSESLSFASDIKPLFREHDRQAMQTVFDLWSVTDVRAHAAAIAARLRDGSMPCDGRWPADRVALFDRWLAEGAPGAMTTHTVESTAETIRSGYLDPAAPPVATIAPGDVVSYPGTWTHWGNEATFGMTFADREPLRHRYPNGPYSMMGPVQVAGAAPGDAVECSLIALRTRDWGWNSFPLGVGALPHDFAKPYVHYFRFDDQRTGAAYVQGITMPLAPFLGVMAVEPAGEEQIRWLHLASGISEGEAYALCSMQVSFRVTQYANQTGPAYTSIPPKAVHGMVPKHIFPDELRQRIGAWLRPGSGSSR